MTSTRTLITTITGLSLALTSTLLPLRASPASAVPVPHSITATVQADSPAGKQFTGGTTAPRLSGNGRFATYSDRDGQTYVKDLLTTKVELVSVNDAGQPANQESWVLDISDDGNRILFNSELATNLSKAPYAEADLYLRDRAAHTTTRVSYLPGNVASYAASAAISGNGKSVVWSDHDTGYTWARDLPNGVATRVDLSSTQAGAIASTSTDELAMSYDGRYVAFRSDADNLVPGNLNPGGATFRRDRVNKTTELASRAMGGVKADGYTFDASMSDDGRYVAFYSYATNLVAGDANGVKGDAFVYDFTTGIMRLVSRNNQGVQGNDTSDQVSISGDGFYVVFQSRATNLAGAGNGFDRLYRRDLFAGTTSILDTATNGTISSLGNNHPVVSDDGTVTAFWSNDANLVPGDTNGTYDALIRLPESMGPHTDLGQFDAAVTGHLGGDAKQVGATTTALTNGRTTTAHVIATLAQGSSCTKDLAPVARLYDAFFRRQPDLGGLDFWVKKHQGGTSLSKVASSFASSSEFKTKYGNTTNAAFVTLVYKNVLDRQPDAPGLQHWVTKMAGGMTRGDVMVAFSESSEGVRHLAPEVDSVVIGLKLLGTMPSKTRYAEAVAARKATGAAEGAALIYLNSAEYAAKH
ncbi:DUF4214 domain-containing protein [Aquihabitans sp. McL0605]|uniref:DUF4214 domain-containing protein n=1 Tax=Aquihabitans sp. McL0605 TaxID=3415671 RepID=UPI003CF1D93A